MAGDWIKIRNDLATDPAVIGVAEALAMDEDHVVGKLCRLWSWADEQSRDGNAVGVTQKWINKYLSVTGFAETLCKFGWLIISDDGIAIPNFDRHNGKPAKERALTTDRAKNFRDKKRNAVGVTKALPEKRREERESNSNQSKKYSRSFSAPTLEEIREVCAKRGNSVDPEAFFAHYESNGWRVGRTPMKSWTAAIRTWEKNQFGGKANAKAMSARPLTDEEIAHGVYNGTTGFTKNVRLCDDPNCQRCKSARKEAEYA